MPILEMMVIFDISPSQLITIRDEPCTRLIYTTPRLIVALLGLQVPTSDALTALCGCKIY
eukprot:m.761344 g.761344  ORF g.761344 m.761344 type:complete len:60 (+) comp23205_c1_seq12:4360-4539(+)